MPSEQQHFSRQELLAALEQERIQYWMRVETIDHYEEHRLPNGGKGREADSITF